MAAGAFKVSLPAERAEKLFNAYTYRSLGYLDGMISNEPFALEARREGFDFEDFFRCKHGVYMHTINHPKMSIVLEMTRQALSKSGIRVISDVAPQTIGRVVGAFGLSILK
ncbi:MAG: hypothetical protein HZT43_19610 [Exiguobacterium profundum]|nr:MAG: hypothetical protein HZT43_19610 [Exiguobacterium profundum]